MKTNTSAFVATALSLTLLMAAAAPAAGTPAPADASSCDGRLLLLIPCAAFVQGAVPDPTDACCDNLANVHRHEPGCLCPLLDLALSLPVNRSLIRQLPLLCRLNLTADAATCSASLSPRGSPPAHASGQPNPSSAAAGSPPPLRMNNWLPAMNRGRRLRGRGASLGFVVILMTSAVCS